MVRRLLNLSLLRVFDKGNPLSPYIFVLCLKRLGHLIEHQVEEGAWKLISHSRGGPKLTHLCFFDEIISLSKADIQYAHVIKDVFHNFCMDSG